MIVRCRPLQRPYNNVWQRYVHIKLIHGPHGFLTGRAWHGLHARSYASHQEPVDLFSTSSQKITVLNVAGMAAELVADQLMEAGAMSAGYTPDPPAGSVRHLTHDEVLHMSPSRNDRALAMEPIHSNFERMHRVEEFRDADEKEQKIYGDTRAVWNRCCVHGLFRAQIDMQSLQEQLQSVTGEASLQYEVEHIQDQEWLQSIRDSYQPARIDEGLWIIPSWCQPEDSSAVNIILEPGIAFGTGDHPTTRLCLKALLSLDLSGKSVMDYGTGSGVLAIAALKMGAAMACGTDTDQLAVRAAAQNAALNGLAGRFQAVQCEGSAEGPEPLAALACGAPSQSGAFDVIIANILQGPLLELSSRLCDYANSGGTIILSGFLDEQWPTIREAYEHELENFQVSQDGQWVAITGIKRDNQPLAVNPSLQSNVNA